MKTVGTIVNKIKDLECKHSEKIGNWCPLPFHRSNQTITELNSKIRRTTSATLGIDLEYLHWVLIHQGYPNGVNQALRVLGVLRSPYLKS